MSLSNGKTAKISIDAEDQESSISEAVKNTFNFLRENENVIREQIAIKMSKLYNETWGDGDTVAPQDVMQRISLRNISFMDEGDGELFYSDGNLFAGHSICVFIEPNGEVDEPYLAG